MSRFFRAAAVVLSLVLLVAFAGCDRVSRPEVTPTPQPEVTPQPTQYTMTLVNWPKEHRQVFAQSTVGRELANRAGVAIDMRYIDGDTQSELTKLAQSGDLGDLLWADGQHDILQKAGKLAELSGYIGGEAGIEGYYRPGELEYINRGMDGTYVLGTQRLQEDMLQAPGGYYFRWDALEAASFPGVQTPAQLISFLTGYLDENAKTEGGLTNLGLGMAPDAWLVDGENMTPFGAMSGELYYGQVTVKPSDYNAKSTWQSTTLKDWMRVMNDMINKKLVDPDIFKQSQEAFEEKVKTGAYVCFYDAQGTLAAQSDAHYVAFPVVLYGAERDYTRGIAQAGTGGLCITSDCDDPGAAYELIALMASDDAQMLSRWGVEGVDYQFNDEGRFTRTQGQWEQVADAAYAQKRGLGALDMFPQREGSTDKQYGRFAEGNWVNPALQQEYPQMIYSEEEKEILANLHNTRLGEMFAPTFFSEHNDPREYIDSLPADDIQRRALEEAHELSKTYHVKIMQAQHKKLDDVWDEYQEKLQAIEGLEAFNQGVAQWVHKLLGE